MAGARRVIVLAALLPALAGLAGAYRLARAGWAYARWGEDPVVTAFIGSERGAEAPPHALRIAAEYAPADFRFPYWAGRRAAISPSASADELLAAYEQLRRAADLAPSVAEARYYLSVVASRLGRFGIADAQAHAALGLAPLQEDLSRRLAAWFFERYRATGDDAQLVAAIRAGGLPEYEARAWLDMPLLTFGEAQRIFDLADVELPDRVDLLLRANRFDWALRAVPPTAADLRRHVRREYGRYLLSIDAFAAAEEELAAAAATDGDGFDGWVDLGVARTRLGRNEAAAEAFRAALGSGTTADEVDAAMARAGLSPETRAGFWSGVKAQGENDPAVSLALGRARLEERRLPEAEAALREALLGSPATEAEANHLLARLFLAAGNRAMAGNYARRAVELAPDRKDYGKFAASLSGDGK